MKCKKKKRRINEFKHSKMKHPCRWTLTYRGVEQPISLQGCSSAGVETTEMIFNQLKTGGQEGQVRGRSWLSVTWGQAEIQGQSEGNETLLMPIRGGFLSGVCFTWLKCWCPWWRCDFIEKLTALKSHIKVFLLLNIVWICCLCYVHLQIKFCQSSLSRKNLSVNAASFYIMHG